MDNYISKNGLLFSKDSHKLLSVENKMAETITLPQDVTELPPYLFEGCTKLTRVSLPIRIDAFPEGLFKDCYSLKDIPFRAGITHLAKSVFENCSSIRAVVVPNTVTTIGSRAFAGCSALETIVLPGGIYDIAPDAFEGCNSVHNIRINGEGGLIYINKDDGCLYLADDEGDRLVISVCNVENNEIEFFKENVDDEPVEADAEDEFEDDDTFFSTEIGATEEEAADMEKTEIETAKDEETGMEHNEMDSMLSQIMDDQKERHNSTDDIGVSEEESKALSGAIEVMSDNKKVSNSYVSNDELASLFEKGEAEERATRKKSADEGSDDPKIETFKQAAKLYKILEFTPNEKAPEEAVLYVVAEKTVTDADGNEAFSSKLIACCSKFARIHDFARVVLLYGLPFENDEFKQFYHQFIAKKNIILACEAERASELSEFGHQVCDLSRISLDKDELREQRKNASIKSNMLIKLVIRDKYQ